MPDLLPGMYLLSIREHDGRENVIKLLKL